MKNFKNILLWASALVLVAGACTKESVINSDEETTLTDPELAWSASSASENRQ